MAEQLVSTTDRCRGAPPAIPLPGVSGTRSGVPVRIPRPPNLARAMLDLEVIVPALNEERRIEPTLTALIDQLGRMRMRSGVVVVDNGSADRTADVVDALSGGPVQVSVRGCARRGKGSAITRGILASSARRVGFCDADLATPAAAIVDALRLLDDGVDVVVGSRRTGGAELAVRQPVLRRVGGAGFRWLTRDLAGSITDTQCGFKFFDGDVARRLFSACTLGGFAFDLEVVARAHRSGLRIAELPVVWRDQPGSTFRVVRDGRRVWQELAQLRRTLAVDEAGPR